MDQRKVNMTQEKHGEQPTNSMSVRHNKKRNKPVDPKQGMTSSFFVFKIGNSISFKDSLGAVH